MTRPDTLPYTFDVNPGPNETDPQVSFDINLRKQLRAGEVVDFNYEAYRKNLQNLGGHDDNSDLSLTVVPKQKLDGAAGQYDYVDKHIDIELRSKAATQKTLQHETHHYIDMLNNPLTKTESVRVGASNALGAIIPPLGVSSMAIQTTEFVASTQFAYNTLVGDIINYSQYETLHGFLDHASSASLATFLGAAALFGYSYMGHNRERIAIKAEKKDLPIVITTSTISR